MSIRFFNFFNKGFIVEKEGTPGGGGGGGGGAGLKIHKNQKKKKTRRRGCQAYLYVHSVKKIA